MICESVLFNNSSEIDVKMRLQSLFNIRYSNIMNLEKAVQFVPKHNPIVQSDIDLLENFLKTRKNILVLTGAGVSTESGKYLQSLKL